MLRSIDGCRVGNFIGSEVGIGLVREHVGTEEERTEVWCPINIVLYQFQNKMLLHSSREVCLESLDCRGESIIELISLPPTWMGTAFPSDL